MRVAEPTAGYSPEFASRLLARHLLYWLRVVRRLVHHQLYWLRVERLLVHHQLYWLSDSGSSKGEHGVTGGGRCREGR